MKRSQTGRRTESAEKFHSGHLLVPPELIAAVARQIADIVPDEERQNAEFIVGTRTMLGLTQKEFAQQAKGRAADS